MKTSWRKRHPNRDLEGWVGVLSTLVLKVLSKWTPYSHCPPFPWEDIPTLSTPLAFSLASTISILVSREIFLKWIWLQHNPRCKPPESNSSPTQNFSVSIKGPLSERTGVSQRLQQVRLKFPI